jgi:hypothetical protein
VSITIVIGANGQPMTVQTFDHEAYAAWKLQQATWRREQYAANAGIRAARSDTNARAYAARKRRKAAQKTTARETG